MNDITTHIDKSMALVECERNVDRHIIVMKEHDTMRLYILISALLLLSSTIRNEEIAKQANCSHSPSDTRPHATHTAMAYTTIVGNSNLLREILFCSNIYVY